MIQYDPLRPLGRHRGIKATGSTAPDVGSSQVQQTCEPRAHAIKACHMVIQGTWAAAGVATRGTLQSLSTLKITCSWRKYVQS